MKGYSSKEIIRILKKDGWYIKRIKGDHHQFIHTTKKGKVTIPHPNRDLPKATTRSIFKQAGIEIKE